MSVFQTLQNGSIIPLCVQQTRHRITQCAFTVSLLGQNKILPYKSTRYITLKPAHTHTHTLLVNRLDCTLKFT